ncbi:nucleoside hydrolase [Naasia lichenicola]|uniref:Nucleoside hydrolase n=1 Tax=Naasia lichenicola TaxID=2565933 RepID=A0A4S4FN84_9MICO|nr:nucleoside hydrolase [Naasia lichenicola]THG30935.1 nucleoside hydrolase [Naasia lichenicola]
MAASASGSESASGSSVEIVHGRPVYFDCDTGIDDSMALLLLVSSDVDVVGIGTVSGNIDADQAARNTLDLLALAQQPDIPVAIGARAFLTTQYAGGVPHIHGRNGVGDIDLPRGGEPVEGDAADLLISLAYEYPGELEIIAVGPMTNLAIALQRDAELASLIRRVTIMGGAAMVPGNLSAAAEANIGHDPEAAQAVFHAPWPLTMVGLDVTLGHTIALEEQWRLTSSDSLCAQAIGRMLELYFDFHVEIFGERCAALHDPLAVAIATGEAIATLAPVVPATVDTTDGPDRGRTVCDLRGRFRDYPERPDAHCTVVLEVAKPFGPTLITRLLALP